MSEVLLDIEDLAVYYPVRGGLLNSVRQQVRAVDGVSLQLKSGQIASVVGESGCGKSTLAKAISGLAPVCRGRMRFGEEELDARRERSPSFRKNCQIVFQDPATSLNPRLTLFEILSEPLLLHTQYKRSEYRDKVAELLQKVELSTAMIDRFPHALSGGQRQRIAIARALATNPALVICDEITSALDVSIQAQILELLLKLGQEMQVAFLFISHDLSLVRTISTELHVMYLGKIVETGPANRVFQHPAHPYTKALIDAVPTLASRRELKALTGEPPSPVDPPSGCHFHTRCPLNDGDRCVHSAPQLSSGVACHHPLQS